MDSLKTDGRYPEITIERGTRIVTGDLVYLSFDSAAVRQTGPRRGGCIRMKIHPPYEQGYILDEEGFINEYGARIIGEILIALDDVTQEMERRLADIETAIETVRASAEERLTNGELSVRVFGAIPGEPLKADLPAFTSTLEAWIELGLFPYHR